MGQARSIRQTVTHQTQSTNRQQKPRGLLKRKKPAPPTTPQTQTSVKATPKPTKTDSVDSHHINKALVVMGALAFVGFVTYAFF